MNIGLFKEFLSSKDTFRAYKDGKLIYSSNKDRIIPLLEYIDLYSTQFDRVTMFDRIIGNAAALLSIKAHCSEVFSPMGSQLAIETLNKYAIKYHLTKTVPYILRPDGKGLCPMENLSMGKDPEIFYIAIKEFISKAPPRNI